MRDEEQDGDVSWGFQEAPLTLSNVQTQFHGLAVTPLPHNVMASDFGMEGPGVVARLDLSLTQPDGSAVVLGCPSFLVDLRGIAMMIISVRGAIEAAGATPALDAHVDRLMAATRGARAEMNEFYKSQRRTQ